MLQVQAKKLETVAILGLRGKLVNGELEILRKAVLPLSDVGAIIVDFAGVQTIDAGGLGILLELRAYAESRGIFLEFINVSQWVAKVLKLARLDSVFTVRLGVELFPAASRQPGSLTELAPCA